MILYIKNLLLPSVDNIMSTFTKTITALEAKSDASDEVAKLHYAKADAASLEATRAAQLAVKLKSAFSI